MKRIAASAGAFLQVRYPFAAPQHIQCNYLADLVMRFTAFYTAFVAMRRFLATAPARSRDRAIHARAVRTNRTNRTNGIHGTNRSNI